MDWKIKTIKQGMRNGTRIRDIAATLKCSDSLVSHYIKKHPELQSLVAEYRTKRVRNRSFTDAALEAMLLSGDYSKVAQVAAELGVDSSTVHRRIKASESLKQAHESLKTRRKFNIGKAKRSKFVPAIVALIRQGKTNKEIAAELGITFSDLHIIKNENRHIFSDIRKQMKDEFEAAVKADRAAGLSVKEISKKYNVSFTRVDYALYTRGKKNG